MHLSLSCSSCLLTFGSLFALLGHSLLTFLGNSRHSQHVWLLFCRAVGHIAGREGLKWLFFAEHVLGQHSVELDQFVSHVTH